MKSSYENFLKEKTVAIVGPAQYMTGLGLGKEIDSFDIVVRLNRSCESIEYFSKDIGSKTDILYSCLIEKPANAGKIDVEKYEKKYKIQHICAPPLSDMKGYASQTIFHDMVDKSKVKDLNQKIPVRIVDHIFHSQLAEIINCRPNTGFLAIYDLLRYDIKKLKIFGFSFYLDGFLKGTKTGIEEDIKKTEKEFTENCFNSKRHIQKNMWNYAKNTLLNKNSISLDPYLNLILSLDNLDKNEFYNKLIHMREANNA